MKLLNALGATGFFLAGGGLVADAAPVQGSVVVSSDPAKPGLSFRLDPPEVIQLAKLVKDGQSADTVPFTAFKGSVACAFLVDATSKTARGPSIKAAADLIAAMKDRPEGQLQVAVFLFGGDLRQIVRFGTPLDTALLAMGNPQVAAGDPQLTQHTWIVSNTATVIKSHLSPAVADRKFLILVTDGKEKDRDLNADDEKAMVASAAADKVNIMVLGNAGGEAGKTSYERLSKISEASGGAFGALSIPGLTLPPAKLPSFTTALFSGGSAVVERKLLAGVRKWQVEFTPAGGAAFRLPRDGAPPPPETTPPSDSTQPPVPTPNPVTPATPENKPAPATKKEGIPIWYYAAPAVALLGLAVFFLTRKKETPAMDAAEDDGGFPTIQPPPPLLPSLTRTPLAWLEMMDADSSREIISATNVRIGRGKDNDIELANKSVSNNHCNVQRGRDGVWSITDIESSNGVLLNEKRIEKSVLQDGDVIELGEVKMRFRIAG